MTARGVLAELDGASEREEISPRWRKLEGLMRVPSLAVAAMLVLGCGSAVADFPDPPDESATRATGPQTAVLAGGCFWGMEGVFERLKGVRDVVSGYSGGEAGTAHYEIVATGTTGHAESIRITYEPTRISYGTLLKVFFSIAHNPTELNFQGPDYGTQYRSVIFFMNADQERVARQYISTLESARVFRHPIVTQVVPFRAFYPAEQYHQHFLDMNPNYPYILLVDMPKIQALERTYPALLARRGN